MIFFWWVVKSLLFPVFIVSPLTQPIQISTAPYPPSVLFSNPAFFKI